MAKLFSAVASILLTLPAWGAAGDWPALSVRVTGPNEVQTAIVYVPREEEATLLTTLQAKSASLIVVHTADEPGVETSPDRRVVDYPLPGQIQVGPPETSLKPISLGQAKRAGTWVTIGGIGLLSTMLYVTSDVAPATAGAITAASLTAVGVRYYPQYLK